MRCLKDVNASRWSPEHTVLRLRPLLHSPPTRSPQHLDLKVFFGIFG